MYRAIILLFTVITANYNVLGAINNSPSNESLMEKKNAPDEILNLAPKTQDEQNTKTSAIFPSLAEVVEPILPAVVNIYTVQQLDFPIIPNDNKLVLGSGFIIDSSGYIITNEHVIKDVEQINIKLMDNTELAATVVGVDSRTDLALLKIQHNKPLPYVKLGDSSKARVGDWVVAIGNPFGLDCSVAAGIVSSKSRDLPLTSDSVVKDYIQTDAPINQGNSGGPLCDMRQEVIGVNTFIFSPSGGSIGIGFAIPSNVVQNVVTQLKQHGKVIRGLLGVTFRPVSTEIAESLNLKEPKGAFIVEVHADGAGHKAGILPGDVISKFANKEINTSRSLPILVAETPIGQEVDIVVIRRGKELALKAKITEASTGTQIDNNKTESNEEFFEKNGVSFLNLTPQLRQQYGINEQISGIIVAAVKYNARWHLLKPGDIIITANDHQLTSTADFKKMYEEAKSANKKNIIITVRKHGGKGLSCELLTVF